MGPRPPPGWRKKGELICSTFRERRWLAEAAAVERDQALPMPLGGRLVVERAPGEGEAVMDARVELDLAFGAGAAEQAAQLLDHRQRRQRVVLGAGDIGFAPDLAEIA